MKIENLSIANFRGIREAHLANLGNMVIIAGQNGSGKSCLYDAVRLLKSIYGGYQQNEWQQWMGEFQIQVSNRPGAFRSMFNDATQELRIVCEFRLSDDERAYIMANSAELLAEAVWKQLLPEAFQWGGYRMAMFAAQFRDRQAEVDERVAKFQPQLASELAQPLIRGECIVPPGGGPRITNSITLSVIFSTFRPRDIGVIDYHGAQRHYGREYVSGINLDLDAVQQQRGQMSLYNYAAKYQNVKSEMAASYLREVLAEKAGVPAAVQSTLTNTLKELFQSFFPEKEFLGPQPTADGGLSFPVQITNAGTHDLDELSAGEKEILYGYLRIRNSAPRHSIILLDEPELHLNPRLIRGLPQFYQKNLGEALGNQIWLVSHSDALLREVVGREKYNVFHMLPCSSVPPGQGQMKPLSVTADLELALVDLVGDLASYRPGGKVVIFEGGGDSDFDQRVTAWLFPELGEQANLISGSNKVRVRALHETLLRASQRGQLPFQFFAVTDADSDYASTDAVNRYSWDVYHIENYFLEPTYIARALSHLTMNNPPSEEEILDELRVCARETMPQLLRHRLSDVANQAMIRAIDAGTDPAAGDIAGELRAAVCRSLDRLSKVVGDDLAADRLRAMEAEISAELETSLANRSWVRAFRGRDILRRFAGRRAQAVPYEAFRNLVLSQMKDAGYKPPGMKGVVDAILAA